MDSDELQTMLVLIGFRELVEPFGSVEWMMVKGLISISFDADIGLYTVSGVHDFVNAEDLLMELEKQL